MTVQRMDRVGMVVSDLVGAVDFFLQVGPELRSEWSAEGREVDRIVGLEPAEKAGSLTLPGFPRREN